MIRGQRWILSTIFFFFFLVNTVRSQDIVVRINNDSLRVKIVELTNEKIRFRYPDMKTGPVYEIPKNQVKTIIYENGTKVTMLYNMYDVSKDLSVHEKKTALKFDVFSPFLNHVTLSYERRLKTGLNLELKGGMIGHLILTRSIDYAEGFLAKAGLKFVRCESGITKGLVYKDPMKGNYIRPELLFSKFISHGDSGRINYTDYAVAVSFGHQDVISRLICIDFFGSVGWGFQTNTYAQTSVYDRREFDFNYAFSHVYFGKKLPLVLSGGFLVGFIF